MQWDYTPVPPRHVHATRLAGIDLRNAGPGMPLQMKRACILCTALSVNRISQIRLVKALVMKINPTPAHFPCGICRCRSSAALPWPPCHPQCRYCARPWKWAMTTLATGTPHTAPSSPGTADRPDTKHAHVHSRPLQCTHPATHGNFCQFPRLFINSLGRRSKPGECRPMSAQLPVDRHCMIKLHKCTAIISVLVLVLEHGALLTCLVSVPVWAFCQCLHCFTL